MATFTAACRPSEGRSPDSAPFDGLQAESLAPLPRNRGKVVHVFVALCDNEHQGIVPVPSTIGNGDDADRDLYWGAAFGVRTFLSRDSDWKLLTTVPNPSDAVIERCVFEHVRGGTLLVADAYRGAEIRRCTQEFLEAAAGCRRDSTVVGRRSGDETVYIGGSANLLVYVGHDGLMDFTLARYPERSDGSKREAIVLACASKAYFAEPLRRAGAEPLLWTTNLMAPEAYVLASALEGWVANESGESIRARAASSYHRYQKCGLKSAMRLFATGW